MIQPPRAAQGPDRADATETQVITDTLNTSPWLRAPVRRSRPCSPPTSAGAARTEAATTNAPTVTRQATTTRGCSLQE